jgi:hypothetical protein
MTKKKDPAAQRLEEHKARLRRIVAFTYKLLDACGTTTLLEIHDDHIKQRRELEIGDLHFNSFSGQSAMGGNTLSVLKDGITLFRIYHQSASFDPDDQYTQVQVFDVDEKRWGSFNRLVSKGSYAIRKELEAKQRREAEAAKKACEAKAEEDKLKSDASRLGVPR